ncbi:MAG: hypothetical protein QXQ70_09965 [Candidatus Caldarchaeum sp.]
MDVELFRAVDCVEYVGPEPRIPALRITITDPVKERTLSSTAPLDTGFAGYILVDQNTYDEFGTAELPREFFGVYRTLAGPVVLKRARVVARIGEAEFETYIETPLHGVGKLLIGRRIASKCDIMLLGSKHKLCLVKQPTNPT